LPQGAEEFTSVSSLSINSGDLDDLAVSDNYDDICLGEQSIFSAKSTPEKATHLYKRSTEEFLEDLQLGEMDLCVESIFDHHQESKHGSGNGLGNLENYCKKFLKLC